MRENIDFASKLLLVIYLLTLAVLISAGAADRIIKTDGNCESKFRRIEYVFFTYRLGCWIADHEEN